MIIPLPAYYRITTWSDGQMSWECCDTRSHQAIYVSHLHGIPLALDEASVMREIHSYERGRRRANGADSGPGPVSLLRVSRPASERRAEASAWLDRSDELAAIYRMHHSGRRASRPLSTQTDDAEWGLEGYAL